MTLTFELDPHIDKVNQHAKHLGQRSLRSKVIVWTPRQTRVHTRPTNCSAWTIKVVGKYKQCIDMDKPNSRVCRVNMTNSPHVHVQIGNNNYILEIC